MSAVRPAPVDRADRRCRTSIAGTALAAALLLIALVPGAAVGWQEPPPQIARADTAGATRGLPLEPARTIRYTAERGTWLSLDVSPDGGTLVFDLLGDIYTLPIGGGRATRLTSGLAYDAQPRFSPDGRRVLFVSDRSGGENLWTMTLDGRDTAQITRGEGNIYISPAWTPDGRSVVASRTHGLGGIAKLWLFHTDGGAGIQLTREPENMKTIGPAFGPDPRYIWFAQATGDWQYDAALPRYQLAVYDRETGRVAPVTARYGSGVRPALSPDGRWLVYGSRYENETGLRRRNLATGEESWLVFPVNRDDMEARATLDALPGYAFTPDSREVVVSFDGRIWRVPIDGGSPREIPFTADVEIALGPEVRFDYTVDAADTFVARQIRDAVPSPDGRRLAFSALGRLHVMDVPGGTPRRLTDATDAGEHAPAWSPDGRSIAYVSWSDAAGGHIWRVAADGRGRPQQVTTTPAFFSQLAWSPDGSRIVAVRSVARERQEATPLIGSELVWVAAGGGEVTTVAPAGGRGTPHFARGDDSRIYAYSGGGGLVSFRWDGTDERRHLRVTGAARAGATTPPPASLVVMSPDGEHALAVVEDHIYLMPVPFVGDAPTISVANPANAPVPVRQLTDVGGQFPRWSADGRRVHWSIGNTHFVYDVERARAFDDSVRAARRAAAAPADTAPAAAGPAAQAARYEPEQHRIRITVQRDIPRGTAVLRGARAITMRGHEIIEDADIVIRDNRIVAIGARGSVDVPGDAHVIDVTGQTIVPGYIDTHAHMRPPGGVHTTWAWPYAANLAYGVTTTRDPQTGTTDVLTYSDMVESGTLIGPRIFSTGPGVFGVYQGAAIQNLEHARRLLRRYSEFYDTKYFKMYLAGNRQTRQWLIMAARELELMPTTEAGLDFKLDLTHAMDGYPGIEHNLPIHPIFDDVVRLFAESGVTYTPTLLVTFGAPMGEHYWFTSENVYGDAKLRRFTPYPDLASRTRRRNAGWFHTDEFMFQRFAEFARDVVAAGGRVGVGGHGQLQGLGWHWELWSVQSGGMSEHDALRAATVLGAEGLGMARDLGTLEAGKLADLVVLERNPLDDIRNSAAIRYVMKNGRLYEGETLNEVWPRQRALEIPDWWEAPPPRRAVTAR
jgi:Tol biopolymer transport system component